MREMTTRSLARLVLAALVLITVPAAAWSQGPANLDALLTGLLAEEPALRRHSLQAIVRLGDRAAIPALIDVLVFDLFLDSSAVRALEQLSGQRFGHDWRRWVEWLETQPSLRPPPGYVAWKGDLFSRIDPAFAEFLYPGVKHRARIEEIQWGGVRKDGIPALTNPRHVKPSAATYLTLDELVLGLSVNGDARAYPLRIMDWHEMANDVVGGTPIAIAYWTLCGSAIHYETTVRGTTYVFGSSGFLFRSNKLMYDQQTKSLWHHMRGEPVVGPLADSGITLTVRPVVTTTWREWLRAHPTTSVLDIDTGYVRDYTPGRPYGRYYESPDTMFPVSPRSARLRTKEFVFALRLPTQAKLYPLEILAREPVVNDTVGGTPVVIVAQAANRTVRAYERGGRRFGPGKATGELIDQGTGEVWVVEEERLLRQGGARQLPRLPGHLAYWFGWHAFHPDTPVYGK